jgi:hypothetical protein
LKVAISTRTAFFLLLLLTTYSFLIASIVAPPDTYTNNY